MKKPVLVLSAIVLILALAAPATLLQPGHTALASETITFPDPNLDAAIRQALGKPAGVPITQAELAGLTELDASDRGVVDLSGLELAANLVILRLNRNRIVDISPLAELSQLVHLQLDSNEISGMPSLASLTSLRTLQLEANRIVNISPLASLTNLEQLSLDFNQIEDVSALVALTQLSFLNLYGNQISNVSPLASLTNLIWLQLGMNRIQEISELADLQGLTHLFLSQNSVVDVTPLSSLTDLTQLRLEGNQVTDVSALTPLMELWVLNIADNPIADIAPLVGNAGIGADDLIYVDGTNLELWHGSEDLDNINVLKTRGASITHDPIVSAVLGKVGLQGGGTGADIYLDGSKVTTTDETNRLLLTAVPAGTHTIAVEMPGYLRAERSGVIVVDAQTTTLPDVTLLGGDANNDGVINIADLVMAASQFGSASPEADINADGVVNILDLTLIGINYGRTESPWTG